MILFALNTMSNAVEKYIKSVPAGRSARLKTLHSIITELNPAVVIDMSYKMPTYKAGEGWVAIANRKNYISLYTCGYHHIESFRNNNPNIKTGKGCINFKDTDDFPVNDIKQVIEHAFSHPKPGHPR